MTPPHEEAARDEAEQELDVAAGRLGIEIPADLAGGVLHGYRGLRDMAALLRRTEPQQPDQVGSQPKGEPDA